MEDHFRETLRHAVSNEPPVQDAWKQFERRVGRARRVRLLTSVAAAAAVIAAGAIVVPHLTHSGRVIVPQTQPPDAYAGWKTFESTVGEFRVRYPADWRVTEFEGTYDILPPGMPAPAVGRP